MKQTIQFPESKKKRVVQTMVFYKLIIRKILYSIHLCWGQIKELDKQKTALEAQDTFFNRYRISKLEEQFEYWRNAYSSSWGDLAEIGHKVFTVAPLIDRYCSFHDKCQLLNISHTRALKELKKHGGDERTTFDKLIFVYALESLHNDGKFLHPFDLQAPLYSAYQEQLISEMKTNLKLKMASDERFNKMLDEAFRARNEPQPAKLTLLTSKPHEVDKCQGK